MDWRRRSLTLEEDWDCFMVRLVKRTWRGVKAKRVEEVAFLWADGVALARMRRASSSAQFSCYVCGVATKRNEAKRFSATATATKTGGRETGFRRLGIRVSSGYKRAYKPPIITFLTFRTRGYFLFYFIFIFWKPWFKFL